MRAFGNDILRSPDKSGRGEISERGVRLPRPDCVGTRDGKTERTRNDEGGDARNDTFHLSLRD